MALKMVTTLHLISVLGVLKFAKNFKVAGSTLVEWTDWDLTEHSM